METIIRKDKSKIKAEKKANIGEKSKPKPDKSSSIPDKNDAMV